MQDGMENHRFPQTLNKPKRIIGLQVDEGISVIASVLLGFILSKLMLAFIVAGILVGALKFFKKGKPSFYLYDAIYWNFPSFCCHRRLRKVPKSYKRIWIK